MTYATDYLTRIGLPAAPSPTVQGLATILRRHVATIAFENLTSYAPTSVAAGATSIEPAAVAAKLLHAGRGGFCYEHAALLRMVLPEFGFQVRPLLGRVYMAPSAEPPLRSHNVTAVTIDGVDYLADPGFGGFTPTGPLRLDLLDTPQDTPHGRYRLVRPHDSDLHPDVIADCEVILQFDLGAGWQSLYGLPLATAPLSEIAAINWFTSTSPDSGFTGELRLALAPEGQRISLRNTDFRIRSDSGVVKRELVTEADVTEALTALHITADVDTIARTVGRLHALTD